MVLVTKMEIAGCSIRKRNTTNTNVESESESEI